MLIKSATLNIPHSGYNAHIRPKWTKEVKELHNVERKIQCILFADGIPSGMIFEFYRNVQIHSRVSLEN